MERKKVVLILEEHEEVAEEGIKKVEKENFDLSIIKNASNLEEEVNDCQAIWVRGAKIARPIIECAPNLKIIARSGVGTDNIDVKAATDNDVFVCNVPDANFTSVAEHVVGLIIALSHQILNSDQALRKGDFNARHRFMGSELKGKTLGLIGFGRIGQLVANKCLRGLEMSVLVYDPYISNKDEYENIQFVDDMDDILTNSDFISLHLPYTPALHHFINSKSFSKMKNSAFLLNCARGGLVDESALADALNSGQIAGAGIDVFEDEPPSQDYHLWNLDNIIVTPHMGASTREALTLMSVGAAEEIINVLQGQKPKNTVN
ncbi:hydroxyacid dehydrogenase [Virgibacillus sp. W0181]|uniref:hydroxyacid dehydrogenase n=1 Tax=Virgibacillus sp. W0181 TaxID=3391581 RepID=UPI003F457DB5